MDRIISDIYEIMKGSSNPIELEQEIQTFMWQLISEAMETILAQINQTIKEEKQKQGWKVKRNDARTIQYVFGPVQYKRSLMEDPNGENHYPLDEWLGIESYQRYSPLVEVQVAELASDATYRDTAKFIEAWTPVELSHQTVKSVVEKVGKIQAQYDQALVADLENSAVLPEGRQIDFFYAEADGVYVRGTEKGKKIEIHHAITYEGWEKNGKRVSLKTPKTVLTTASTTKFWEEVQTLTANDYSLENTRVITNSDGGPGYTAEKFQSAFSQSKYPVVNQLDAYHITQSLNRTFGMQDKQFKPEVRKAIQTKDPETFELWVTTYESTLEEEKDIEKVKDFRTYITNNWNRIFDWRDEIDGAPAEARGLGAMESNQRRITYRMKKRGMHWSMTGCEAMVKVKQGIFNGTLRTAYLGHIHRSTRQRRVDKKVIRISTLLNSKPRPSIGAKQGNIPVNAPSSSPMGQLSKAFR
jgi:hypothetical protein